MARLDEQRRALAMNLRFNRAAENELTPAQARLFVRSLQTSWQVPPIAWARTPGWSRTCGPGRRGSLAGDGSRPASFRKAA